MTSPESLLEERFIEKLCELKSEYRADIRDRAAPEQTLRDHFLTLNGVTLTDAEFARLLDEIVTPDVFATSQILREINTFSRDAGTPLNCTHVSWT